MKPVEILFVCTGNTCRSPMAKALAEKFIDVFFKGLEGLFFIGSAGIQSVSGYEASPMAVSALGEIGIELKDFTTNKINAAMIAEVDLVITATSYQRDSLIDSYPQAIKKTYSLKEFIYKFLKNDPLVLDITENISKRLSEMVVYNSSVDKWLEIMEALNTIPNEEINIDNFDIADPIGGDINAYRQTRNELDAFIKYFILFLIGGKTWKKGLKGS